MANQTTARWALGLPDGLSGRAITAFKALERILGRLHGRVEYPAPSVETRVAAAATTAITSVTPVSTGASLTYTPEVDGTAVITGTFMIRCDVFASITHYFRGALYIDGTEIATVERGTVSATGVNFRLAATQLWTVPMTAKANKTFALYAWTDNVGTQYTVVGPGTGFVFMFFPSPYKYPA